MSLRGRIRERREARERQHYSFCPDLHGVGSGFWRLPPGPGDIGITKKQFENREVPNEDRGAARDRDDSRPGGVTHHHTTRSTDITYSFAGTDLSKYIIGASGPEFAIGADEKPALPEREDSMPILAWKWAQLARNDRGWWFAGIGQGVEHRYRSRSVARCLDDADNPMSYAALKRQFMAFGYGGGAEERPKRTPHDAPGPDCKCGFYGLASPPETPDGYTIEDLRVLLDVEFYGRVIVHEHGYRAEKQRVLAARVTARCEFCP